MKKLLFLVFMIFSVCSYAQREGDYDVSIHAAELLEVDVNTMVASDTTVYLMDVAYYEWSADGVTFRKNYVLNDTWARYSGYSKLEWDTIRVALNLWEVSGDTLKPIIQSIVYGDTVTSTNSFSDVYFLGSDTLSHTNIYNGKDGVDGYVLTFSSDTAIWQPQASGDRNTARNVGVAGFGVFQDTLLSELQFRNIASADTFINLSLEDSTIYIEWDGEGRNIIAGIGLLGTGNLASDVTISLYIPELPELIDNISNDDWIAIYDQSSSQHKKTHITALLPDVYVDNIKDADNVSIFNFKGSDGISILGGGNGDVQFTADPIVLMIDSVAYKTRIDTLNLVAGDNIIIDYADNGVVTISSTGGGGVLPTCNDGEFLAMVGGEWACVNVCDYICADTIISIINNYTDTVPAIIAPSGDVAINFTRDDCEDSTQVTAAMLASETLNLTTIKIVTVPTVGELHYNGVLVSAGQEIAVTQGSFYNGLYYLSDDGTGSSYADLFTFQLLYSSNQDYLGTANVSVSVSACVTESVCFGYLYNWYALDDSRELTSSADWSTPTTTDFYNLRVYLDPVGSKTDNTAGGKLKSTGLVYWDSPNTDATDEYGFNSKGAGMRTAVGSFAGNMNYGYFYMEENPYIPSSAFYNIIEYNTSNLLTSSSGVGTSVEKETGYSTRLVKDATGLADGVTTTYTGNDGKIYNAIVINELYWTTENLEETQYRTGDAIQFEGANEGYLTDAEWAALTTGALCVYDNDWNNACKTPLPVEVDRCFGYLYNWYVIDDSRELTSSDAWAAPTTTQYENLITNLGGDTAAAIALTTSNLFDWDNPTGDNSSGFSGKGAGSRRYNDYLFYGIRDFSYYWKSDISANAFRLGPLTAVASWYYGIKSGNPIRLVSSTPATSYTGNDGKTYGVVEINGLYWTTENLEETQYRDGSAIPNVTDNTTWAGLTTGAWCVYDNNDNYKCK